MQVDSSDKAEVKPEGTDGEKESTADGGKEGSAEGQAEAQKAKTLKEPEPSSHCLDNPARVVPAQEKLVKFPEGSRYMPIRSGRTAGILLLKDSTPGTVECKREREKVHTLCPCLSASHPYQLLHWDMASFSCSACCFCHRSDAVLAHLIFVSSQSVRMPLLL